MSVSSTYAPIAIGFWLLALPLVASIFLADTPAGAWTNGIAAGVMVLLGLAVIVRRGKR